MILPATKAMKHIIVKWLHLKVVYVDDNHGRRELIDQLQDKLYEALNLVEELRRKNSLLEEQLQSNNKSKP